MTFSAQHWPVQPMSGEPPALFSQVLRQMAEPFARFASAAQSQQASVQQWGGIGASVTLASPELIALLERFYMLYQRERVLTFLESRPHLVALLLELFGPIRLYFQGMRVALQVTESEEDASEQLGVYILVPADKPEQALARLTAFDEGWWLDAMNRARGDLFITVTAA